MVHLTLSEVRTELPTALKSLKKSPISVTKHGEPVAVIVDPSQFEKMLEAMEELEDIAAYDEAMTDRENIKWVPLSKVLKDLGLERPL